MKKLFGRSVSLERRWSFRSSLSSNLMDSIAISPPQLSVLVLYVLQNNTVKEELGIVRGHPPASLERAELALWQVERKRHAFGELLAFDGPGWDLQGVGCVLSRLILQTGVPF